MRVAIVRALTHRGLFCAMQPANYRSGPAHGHDVFSPPIRTADPIAAIFYFLVMRPQQQATKKLREAVDNVRRGDTVVLSSGIIGRVAKVPQKDDPEISVEIADNVQVRVLRGALTEVRAKSQPVEAKSDKS